MKNKYIVLILLFLMTLTIIYAGGQGEKNDSDWLQSPWDEISTAAENTEVNFYMWGGSASINQWVDNVVAPALLKKHQLTLKRIPMDASVFINQLLTEKAVGKNKGSIDLIWINGENFNRAKKEGLLYGSFSPKLPNFALVDSRSVSYDFGTATEGFESPLGRAQFVFEYDSALVQNPPRNFEELLNWTRENPGLFTYSQPPDFTGSTFLRQALYATSGGYEIFSVEYNKDFFDSHSTSLWNYLNKIKPYLWQQGKTYPSDKARLDGLFEQGEVRFNMTYTQAEASGKITDGRYPPTIRTLVFNEGSISNTHFTSIPWNAPNVPGAMVLANFLLSPEMQYSKNIPENWGDFTVLDPRKLDEEWQLKFKSLDLGMATLPLDELTSVSVPEISPSYVEAIEQAWYREVLEK